MPAIRLVSLAVLRTAYGGGQCCINKATTLHVPNKTRMGRSPPPPSPQIELSFRVRSGRLGSPLLCTSTANLNTFQPRERRRASIRETTDFRTHRSTALSTLFRRNVVGFRGFKIGISTANPHRATSSHHIARNKRSRTPPTSHFSPITSTP